MAGKSYEVDLEFFEGPMDLLVHLVKKNDIDIYNIPIAEITDQYMEYMDYLNLLNIDFASEFIFMASTLAHIKSRMLLPMSGDEEDDEDPRLEIVRPLLEYLEIKSISEKLLERELLGENTFTRSPEKGIFDIQEKEFVQVGLFELVSAFKKIVDNIYDDHKVDYSTETISIKDTILEIIKKLEINSSITFNELFDESYTKKKLIISFLAVLEMCKMNLIEVVQHTQSGIMRVFYL